MTRTRAVVTAMANGGQPCPDLLQSSPCNTDPCTANVDCVLTMWSLWSNCSSSCGGGNRNRTRAVTVNASGVGLACESLVDSEACNTQVCTDCVVSDWTAWGSCSVDISLFFPRLLFSGVSVITDLISIYRFSAVEEINLDRGTCLFPRPPERHVPPYRSRNNATSTIATRRSIAICRHGVSGRVALSAVATVAP